jgi:hypothetical protein
MLECARVKAESPKAHIPLIQLDMRDFSRSAGGLNFLLIAAALFGRLRRPSAAKIALRPAEPATLNRDATPASARRRTFPRRARYVPFGLWSNNSSTARPAKMELSTATARPGTFEFANEDRKGFTRAKDWAAAFVEWKSEYVSDFRGEHRAALRSKWSH